MTITNILFSDQGSFIQLIKLADESTLIGRFETSLQILDQMSSIDLLEKQKFEILWRKGRLNWIIGKPAIALECFLKAKSSSVFMKDKCKTSLSDACIRIVNLYFEAKKYREIRNPNCAVSSFREAIELSRSIRQPEFEMKCQRQMSLVFLDMSDLRQFLECNERALFLAREMQYKKEEGYCLNNVGLYFYKIDQYSKALDKYKDSLRIAREEGNVKSQSECLTNIGAIYKIIGEYDRALSVFNESLSIDKSIGDEEYILIDINNIAVIHRKKWLENDSVDSLKEAIFYQIMPENPRLLSLGMNGITE